jgi:hypothetical protein
VGWPSTGVFAPNEGSSQDFYDPMSCADKILIDVQRTRLDDAKALLGFVNRWGVLGVGIHGVPDFGADEVALSSNWLKQLQQWTEILYALENGEETNTTWAEFAAALNEHLNGIHPFVIATDRRAKRGFRASRLLDALCYALWNQASTEGNRLRRCPECHALFAPGRANQEYCDRRCANRPTVRKWKHEQRRKRQLERRRK